MVEIQVPSLLPDPHPQRSPRCLPADSEPPRSPSSEQPSPEYNAPPFKLFPTPRKSCRSRCLLLFSLQRSAHIYRIRSGFSCCYIHLPPLQHINHWFYLLFCRRSLASYLQRPLRNRSLPHRKGRRVRPEIHTL